MIVQQRVGRASGLLMMLLLVAGGCAHHQAAGNTAKMAPGTGAITGEFIGPDGEPFDASLLDDGASRLLTVKLHDNAGAITETEAHADQQPAFVFNNVSPGAYELSVYKVVRGKRTIAGSAPVSIDAGQVSPVRLTLQVTPEGAK